MNLKFNCYNVESTNLLKTAAILAEKAYLQGARAFIKCPSPEVLSQLDNVIWTFGRLKFIPHGTSNDPQTDQQPILLSSDLTGSSAFEVVMLVNIKQDELIEALIKLEEVDKLNKVLFINCSLHGLEGSMFADLIAKSSFAPIADFESFKQQEDGSWQKLA